MAEPLGQEDDQTTVAKRLTSFVERIERLTEEKDAIQEDLKEVYGESKAVGFDVPTVKRIVKLRAMDAEKRAEAEILLDTYSKAVGLH